MKRILVMASGSLLVGTIASRLAGEISPDSIHVTRHKLDKNDHQSLVMFIQEGKGESGSVFYSFYSLPYKTQEGEKRVTAHFTRAFTGFDI
jgi:hypothetical protein